MEQKNVQNSTKIEKNSNVKPFLKAAVPGVAAATIGCITRIATGSDGASLALAFLTGTGVAVAIYGNETLKQGVKLSKEINQSYNIYNLD